jgi:hypothetical protein
MITVKKESRKVQFIITNSSNKLTSIAILLIKVSLISLINNKFKEHINKEVSNQSNLILSRMKKKMRVTKKAQMSLLKEKEDFNWSNRSQ